jgi:hypothetical protein
MEISEFLVAFLSQDSDTARTSGLAKAVTKTNLGRRLLNMHETKAFTVTEVNKMRLTWGVGVLLEATGTGLTSTSPEE